MEVKAYENPLPFIYIENLYTEEELKGIWAELDYYQANGNILGNGTRPAKDENDQEKIINLMEKIDNHDDVNNVYSNFILSSNV